MLVSRHPHGRTRGNGKIISEINFKFTNRILLARYTTGDKTLTFVKLYYPVTLNSNYLQPDLHKLTYSEAEWIN
jgi:hypothetical protein